MAVQFTLYPICGKVGEIGSKCLFCGTTIVQKEKIIATNARIVKVRTVSPQEYANKISIYHEIDSKLNFSIVRIGDQKGVINHNGDLIWPLGNYRIRLVSDFVIFVGHDFYTSQYVNLETLEEADFHLFVKDPNNPQQLHRLKEPRTWSIENSYENINGEINKYKYAEKIGKLDKQSASGTYLLHKENGCALWIIGKKYNCILENIKSAKEAVWQGDEEILPIELTDGRIVNITLTRKTTIGLIYFNTEDIYEEWAKKTGFDLPIKRMEKTSTKNEKPVVKKTISEYLIIFTVIYFLLKICRIFGLL